MIGDLYDAKNVVVGQAAVAVAPAFTPLPALSTLNLADPFSPAPWAYALVSASAAISAGSYTLTYAFLDVNYTTAANAYNDPAATVAGRIATALSPLGITPSQIFVTGGPPDATTTPMLITLDEAYQGGTWSLTPTGITGGTLSVTQPVWEFVGATDQGWTWASAKTLQDITIEEQSTLVDRLMQSQQMTITGALSEDVSNTLKIVHNMTYAIFAPTGTTPGYEQLNLSDNITNYAVALIMANNFTYPRVLYIPQTTCLDNVSTPMRRAAAKRMYSAQFTSICQTNLIEVVNIITPHS